ncbi:MAG: PadR family transcriptional regulator [Acidimicrobiia bacterium]
MSYAAPPPWFIRRRMMAMGGHRGWRGWSSGPGGEFPMGPGPFFGGRAKVGRGDVRLAILHLLTEEPMHGYQIMQEIKERSNGIWQPSPGAIYPTLQQLEDEGLVRAEEDEGKKVYRLTDEGMAAAGEAEGTAPWERFESHAHDDLVDLRDVAFQVGAAVMQVARAGSKDQVGKAKEILEEAKSKIYQLLADDKG